MKKIFMMIIGSLAIVACQADEQVSDKNAIAKSKIELLKANSELTKKGKKQVISLQGTIQFLNLEGGFYGIVTDEGKKLLPMNLDKAFHKPGAIVKVSGEYVDIMTIQQWGTPFKITDIQLIKEGQGDSNQANY
jgi:hypothetical protein